MSKARTALRLAAAALAASVLAAACSTTLEAEDYETSCTNDGECVTVAVGDICDCGCDSGAINIVDLPRYQEDRGDIECSTDCGPCPELPSAVCMQGTCQVASP